MAPKRKRRKRKERMHVSIILDRTGSMEAIRDDTIGGFNTFLDEQKKAPGDATITLAQFDSQGPYEVVYEFAPMADAEKLTRETFVPRAMTPLLDAMGRGINELEKKIADLSKAKRPSKVLLVVITDGQENASREFRKDQIAKMVKERQDDGWQIVFLGADLDAINDAMSVGIAARTTMATDKTPAGQAAAYRSLSIQTAFFANGGSFAFTDEDRAAQASEQGL